MCACVCACVRVCVCETESGAYLICGMDGGRQEAYPFTASIKLNIRRMRNFSSKDTQEQCQILGETFFSRKNAENFYFEHFFSSIFLTINLHAIKQFVTFKLLFKTF